MQGLVYVLSGRTRKLGFRSRDEAVTRDRSLGLVGSLRLDRRWVLFIIILPFLGMFAYLIARGGGMQQRSTQQTAEVQKQQDAYIKSVAGPRRRRQRARPDRVWRSSCWTTGSSRRLSSAR